MARINRQSPSGYAIFCDEVRQETTGKLIFIGVYSANDMTVLGESWPVTLTKLSVFVSYYENRDTFLSLSEISIYLPGESDGEPSFRFPRPPEEALQAIMPDPPPDDDDGDMMKGIISFYQFSPLVIKQEGRIRVVAQVRDDSLKLGSLYVRRVPIPDEMKLTIQR